MLAERFTRFVTQSQKHAVFVVLLSSVLPLMGWLSAVVVALVTLQRGMVDGLIIVLWSSLPYIAFLYTGSWIPFAHGVLFGSLFVWVLAIILRKYSSLALAIESAIIIGVIAVLVVYGFMDNVHGWWMHHIMSNVDKIAVTTGVSLKMDLVKQTANILAQYLTGLQTAFIILGVVLELMIARSLQFCLQDPGEWSKEWTEFRLSYFMVGLLVGCGLLAWCGIGLFKDVLPVLVLPFILSGTSLMHGLMSIFGASRIFIYLFYLLLVMIFTLLPLLLGILIVAAIADTFFDFRKRIKNKFLARKVVS